MSCADISKLVSRWSFYISNVLTALTPLATAATMHMYVDHGCEVGDWKDLFASHLYLSPLSLAGALLFLLVLYTNLLSNRILVAGLHLLSVGLLIADGAISAQLAMEIECDEEVELGLRVSAGLSLTAGILSLLMGLGPFKPLEDGENVLSSRNIGQQWGNVKYSRRAPRDFA